MASHKHGTMDVSEQERTFAGFLKVCVGVATISAAILIFLGFVGT